MLMLILRKKKSIIRASPEHVIIHSISLWQIMNDIIYSNNHVVIIMHNVESEPLWPYIFIIEILKNIHLYISEYLNR